MGQRTIWRLTLPALIMATLPALNACDGTDGTAARSADRVHRSVDLDSPALAKHRLGDWHRRTLIRTVVPAATGGTFSDNPGDPRVTVTVPPGALDRDAVLRVRLRRVHGRLADTQYPASDAFRVTLTPLDRHHHRVELSQSFKLEIAADKAPEHPQIGEIARLGWRKWRRLDANFYRATQQSVVALSKHTRGTYRVVFRSLQTARGRAVRRGREVFQFETFGNENFFGPVIGLHELLNEVRPVDAVALGVQVDLTRVPKGIVDVMIGDDLDAKDAALVDPAVTRALIRAGAVIGVKGVFADGHSHDNGKGTHTRERSHDDELGSDRMVAAGITCALCHLNVAPTEFELNAGTVALPIGDPQFDGRPNTQMDAGAILALTPFVQTAGQPVIDLLNSWGPGRFDIRALPDNVLEDGVNNPTDNPPLWNFLDLAEQHYTFGWDGLFVNDGVNNNALASQAEAVYDLVMHGNGAFGTANGTIPPELSIVPPQELLDALAQAEVDQPGNDIGARPLLDLQAWMRSIASPAPGGFDEDLALQGFELFQGDAGCATCHRSPEFTGPGLFSVTVDPPAGGLAGGIHIPGLRGVSQTAPYFHDHSAADLPAVLDRLVDVGAAPPLTITERAALVEYLKSL